MDDQPAVPSTRTLPPTEFRVEITQDGRAGNIVYREAAGEFSTWWEFAGGGRVVVFMAVPTPEDWDRRVPWAAGQRDEILARVGSEAVRQKAPDSAYEVEDRWLNVLWPAVTKTR